MFSKSFWCALAFITPAQAKSHICACTENMGDCLSPYSQEILHKWYQQIENSVHFHFVLRTLSLKTRLQVDICVGAQRLILCFDELFRLFCGTGALVKIGRSY
jgi:hypothetical protein